MVNNNQCHAHNVLSWHHVIQHKVNSIVHGSILRSSLQNAMLWTWRFISIITTFKQQTLFYTSAIQFKSSQTTSLQQILQFSSHLCFCLQSFLFPCVKEMKASGINSQAVSWIILYKQQTASKDTFLLLPPCTGPSLWFITFLHMKNRHNVFLCAVGSCFMTGLRSRIFGCKSYHHKTSII